MATYGYVRVSTAEQNEGRQLVTMAEHGVPRENVFVDKASGKDMDRPAWGELMGVVKAGDTIVFGELSRLGRNYGEVTATWRELTRDRGIKLKVLDIDFFDSDRFAAMGDVGVCVEDMLLSLLAYVAQSERKKMLERQAEGIALAKAAGKYKGSRKREFDEGRIAAATEMLDEGKSKAEVARYLGVHPNTLYNMMRDGRLVREAA